MTVMQKNQIIFFCAKANLSKMRINASLLFASCAIYVNSETEESAKTVITEADCSCATGTSCIIPPECELRVQNKSKLRVRKYKASKTCPDCPDAPAAATRKIIYNAIPVFEQPIAPAYQATKTTRYTPSYVKAPSATSSDDSIAGNGVQISEAFTSEEAPSSELVTDSAKQPATPAVSIIVNPNESVPTSTSQQNEVYQSENSVAPSRKRWFRRRSSRAEGDITSRIAAVYRQPVMHETEVHNVMVPVKPRLTLSDRYRLRRAARRAASQCNEGENCSNVQLVNATSS